MSRHTESESSYTSVITALKGAAVIGGTMVVIALTPLADVEPRLWIGLAGALLFAGGIWTLRSAKLAPRPFEVGLTRAELGRDGLGAVVDEIRDATMVNDPAHIRFDSSNNLHSRVWDGRLREIDAVLTWEAQGKSWFWLEGSFVVPKDEFRILTKRSWFRRSSRRAKVFIGRRRFDGWISVESAERYERWKSPLNHST